MICSVSFSTRRHDPIPRFTPPSTFFPRPTAPTFLSYPHADIMVRRRPGLSISIPMGQPRFRRVGLSKLLSLSTVVLRKLYRDAFAYVSCLPISFVSAFLCWSVPLSVSGVFVPFSSLSLPFRGIAFSWCRVPVSIFNSRIFEC